MKAAIYARVSDDKLKDDGERRQDVQRQIDRLMPYVQLWLDQNPAWDRDVAIFKDDGKSAFKEDYQSRPDFLNLLKEARGNHVHRVYVETLDRWSRRVVDGLTTMQKTSDHGLTVVSIAEGEVDVTSSQGWFRCALAFVMAEWASRDKSDKVKQAMQRRAGDSRKACKSCSDRLGKEVIHQGRHPNLCDCLQCRKKG